MSVYQPEKIHSVMLKLSGEVLGGAKGYGFDEEVIDFLTDEIISVKSLGLSIAIVLGGGNIFRGGSWKNQSLDRVALDSIGMMATVQNALYLAEVLSSKNAAAKVFSCLALDKITNHYSPQKAIKALEKGMICFISGGTGNPYFTTDTAAVLRAIELKQDIVLKATKVEGLFSADPNKDPSARFIAHASYAECLDKKLAVMDMTAFSLAQENAMPLKIFKLDAPGSLLRAITMPDIGTYIHP